MSQRFDLGVHYLLQKEHDKAVRAFQEVLHEDPLNARAWSYLGMAQAHLGKAADAEGSLSRAIALAPQNAEAWFHLGVARSLRSEWPEAASAYRHAVALVPEDLVAWHRLGVALAECGEEDAASAAFERALVLSRETGERPLEEPLRSTETGDVHLSEVGEKETAREARSWIDLALSLLSLGEEDEAIAAYERAYTLDPERASRSLFRPMLQLVAAAASPEDPDGEQLPGTMAAGPVLPPTTRRPQPPTPEHRPEVG
ncbi:MAG: tetratricopeptide repeat protein [Thermoplasmata archaeon]|nr:tetratricopeptide repeat protein [Thermoplasmata archaeon]